ncbi:MAG: oligosaccharide flippase family protein [Burkholderiaceae bacterium]
MLTFAKAMFPTMAALAVQFLAFVITARGLGAERFGIYAGILAVASIGADVLGFGAIDLLVRGTARNQRDFPRYLGHLLWLTLATAPVVILGALIVATQIMNVPFPGWLLVGAIVAEMMNSRTFVYTEAIMVAQQDPVRAAWSRVAGAITRLAAAVVYFVALSRSDIEGWVVCIAGVSLLTMFIAYRICTALYGRPVSCLMRGELRAGVVLCLTQIAASVQANVDRVVLTRFAPAAEVGGYGAAARFMQLGLLPLQVATRITYPKFFSAGNSGAVKGLRFALRVAGPMAAIGIGACLLVIAASHLIPSLLGRDFSSAIGILTVLAFALPAIALQTPPADVLTADNLHTLRATIIWLTTACFLGFAVMGAKLGGALGIAVAFVLTQLLLAVANWGALLVVVRRRRVRR